MTLSDYTAIPYRGTATEWLECIACSAKYEVGPMFFGCPACAAAVEMRYTDRPFLLPTTNTRGVWEWSNLLPTIAPEAQISLGEGETRLLPLRELNATRGPEVFLKNETSNPTWSWKDRPNSISVSMAKHFGFEHVIAISTGNHGNAMAAMAASGGLQSTVFCNAKAPALQLAMMKGYGANIVRGGDSEAMVLDLLQRGGFFPCTILSPQAGYSNPFGVEGFKTIAFEIWQQLGRIPDRVFVGAGSGDGIYGIWKGFRELRQCGAVHTVPRIIGCQAIGANSLVRAFRNRDRKITPLESAETVASSLIELAVGAQALGAVYDSDGAALEVSDEETLASMHWLAKRGIALEPSSAVPLACLRHMLASKDSERYAGETWVSIGSGAAPKWPDDVLRGFTMPEALPDNQTVLEY